MKQQMDMDVMDFARKISMLTKHTPVADQFDMEHGQRDNRWWSCQREHLTVWCMHQPTVGVEGFLHVPNHSARKMYNQYGRPETLLWLAEALGENKEKLIHIVDEIKDKPARTACSVIRREQNIPFDRIVELLG
jgi:hypothetical protein